MTETEKHKLTNRIVKAFTLSNVQARMPPMSFNEFSELMAIARRKAADQNAAEPHRALK